MALKTFAEIKSSQLIKIRKNFELQEVQQNMLV